MLTKAAFELFADLLSDAALLVDANGILEDMNRTARRLFGLEKSQVAGFDLGERVEDPAALLAFLKSCARSSEGLPGSVQPLAGEQPLTGWGALVRPPRDGRAGTVFLRLSETDVRRRFQLLNEQVERLAEELDRRRIAESRLRMKEIILQEQYRLAAFTGDSALAISQETDLDRMLMRCAETLVRHLDAAFAGIWLLEDHRPTLALRACAGEFAAANGPPNQIGLGKGAIGRIAQYQNPRLMPSVDQESNDRDLDWACREGLQSFAGQPLVVEGRTLGVMAMFARHELTEATASALASVAGALASGIGRKRVEGALHDSVAALERADLRKNEYVAMLAHELRGPLAPIRHLVEQVRRGADIEDTLPRVDDQLRHIVRLVDDLLDVSRVSQGKIALKLDPIDVGTWIGRALEAAAPAIEQRHHRLLYDPPERDIGIVGDSFRLRQVLVNLLHNAAKYTPDEGTIEVRVADLGSTMSVTVKDNGVGIAPDFLPEVFEMFSQSKRSLARQAGGLGVGLSLARHLVEAHGGTLTASSEGTDKGSVFQLTLPIKAELQDEHEDHGASVIVAGPRASIDEARILVVDDNQESANTLRDLLELMGCQRVDIGYDGREGLDLATKNPYDALILDIGLPELDGYQLARAVRASEANASSLLIALTGYGGPEDMRLSKEAGFDYHLVKPLDMSALEALFLQPQNDETEL